MRPVPMTQRFHLFPFRTQKLSSVVPKILGWRRPGKIGRRRLLFFYSGFFMSRDFCLKGASLIGAFEKNDSKANF